MTEALNLYRCLSIQSHFQNQVFGGLYMRNYVPILSSFFVTSTYCTIRLVNSIPWTHHFMYQLLAIAPFSQILFASAIISQEHDRSRKVLDVAFPEMQASRYRSMEQQIGVKAALAVVQKEITALTPLKTWISGMCFMQRSAKLTLIALVVEILLNVLIAY